MQCALVPQASAPWRIIEKAFPVAPLFSFCEKSVTTLEMMSCAKKFLIVLPFVSAALAAVDPTRAAQRPGSLKKGFKPQGLCHAF
jgi:hypothetical protein